MTRTMFDAITPSRIPHPPAPQLVAGYVGGYWPSFYGYRDDTGVWVPGIREVFPTSRPVAIAVQASQDAQVLDVEAGDATPAQAPGWAVRQRRRGQIPTVYANTSTWPAVVAEFTRQSVPLALWWEANYDGAAVLAPGRIAKQYRNTPGYDVSVVADYWPGVDPVQTGDNMTPAEVVAAVLEAKVSDYAKVAANDDTGTVAQTIHDARQIARRAELAALQAVSGQAALVAALAALTPGAVDLAAITKAAEDGAAAALSGYTLTLSSAVAP